MDSKTDNEILYKGNKILLEKGDKMKINLDEASSRISNNVTILRFFAAILVIFCHSFHIGMNQEDPFSVITGGRLNFGGFAVAIFFFLSGFYITKSLEKTTSLKDFFIKRGKIIFPQLWIVILLTIVVVGLFFSKAGIKEYLLDKTTYVYLLNMILIPIHNLPFSFQENIYGATVNGALWTMPVEMFAYIVLGFMSFFCNKILKKRISAVGLHILSTMILMLGLLYADFALESAFFSAIFRALLLFFVGCLYADYRKRIVLDWRIACVLILVMLIGVFTIVVNYVVVFTLPYIICCLIIGTRQLKRVPIVFNASYEMYLLGWPIQQMVTSLFGGSMNTYLNFLITVPIDVALALLIYYLVEGRKKKYQ